MEPFFTKTTNFRLPVDARCPRGTRFGTLKYIVWFTLCAFESRVFILEWVFLFHFPAMIAQKMVNEKIGIPSIGIVAPIVSLKNEAHFSSHLKYPRKDTFVLLFLYFILILFLLLFIRFCTLDVRTIARACVCQYFSPIF